MILADRRGTVTSWSDAAADLMDLPADAAVGRSLNLLLEEEEGRDILPSLADLCDDAMLPAPVMHVRARAGGASPSGSQRPFRLTFVRATDERVALILGERRRSHGARVNRFGLLEEVAHQVSEGVLLASAEIEGRGPQVLYANDAACALLGRVGEDLRGRQLLDVLDPGGRDGLRTPVYEALREGAEHVTEQVVVEHPDGRRALVEWRLRAVRTSEGEITHYVSVQRDVTDDDLRGGSLRGALVDPLTGLPNRERFLERLARSVGWAERGEHYAFTVLGFEIVALDEAERRWGVAVANLLVEALAWRVRRCLRPNDLVARIGHARLGVLLEHYAEEWDLEDLLGRIRREISMPYVIGGHRIQQAATGGALPVLRRGHLPGDAEAVLGDLERGLSASAAHEAPAGFLRLRVGEGVPREVSGPVGLELRRAVAADELRLRYQPILRLEDGGVEGLEALLVWDHPTRGLLPARAFFHHAEATGVVPLLGRWVTREACAHLGRWREQWPGLAIPPVHLNVSTAEFWDPDPLGRLLEIFELAGSDPRDFRLEVSEGTLSRNPAAASLVVERMVAAGFEVWLEGFGGERLSLRDLLWMPFRHFKLDNGLLWEESRSGGRQPSPYLLALARLAQELGRTVVASSVETLAERKRLRPDSCALGQGSFFARPVEAADVPALLGASVELTRP